MKVEILVKDIRREKNISLKKLSNKSRVSTNYINDIENNIKSPSLHIMIRLAKALNVDITKLYKVKW